MEQWLLNPTASKVGVPDLASKSPGHTVKFEFQVNNKEFLI